MKQLKKENTSKQEVFSEYNFIASALKMGLTLKDLEEISFMGVYKMMISMMDNEELVKKATQEDIDDLFR